MAALGRAGLKALEALRSSLPARRVEGLRFTREVPTPKPPDTPFVEPPSAPWIRRQPSTEPRQVKIPQLTDEIDPATNRQIVRDVDFTVRPVSQDAFTEFDELFRNDRQGTIFALFEEIENVESIDRLYLVTELMRRYRPQMLPRQARVLEQSLEEAANRLRIPPEVGGIRIATYATPAADVVPTSRTFMSGKALLDEVNDLGRTVKNKTVDPFELIANLNRYDKGADGGILGRQIMSGTAGDAPDQRLIRNQINYWRREAFKKTELTDADFQGLRGLRYSDDMTEAEKFNRTRAALHTATNEDEVAMIVTSSRGNVVSPNYTDVLDDLASRMILDIAGDMPFNATGSGLGRSVPGSRIYFGRMEDPTNVDDFFVQNPFIGPLMQSPIGARFAQAALRRAGLPEIPESLLRTPAPRPSRSRGVNIEPRRPTPSPFEELGSATSGPTGYGPVFRGAEPEWSTLRPAGRGEVLTQRTIEFQNAFIETGVRSEIVRGAGRISDDILNKGTDVQQRWARRFANERIDQMMSRDPAVRRQVAETMREAVRNDWVEPGLLNEMRRIVRQGERTGRGGLRHTPGSSPVPAAEAPAIKIPMNFKDGDKAKGVALRMAPGNEGKSTMDLILEGKRTGTTRSSLGQFRKSDGSMLEVGDIVEFTDRSGRSVRVQVTKAPYQLPRSSDPAEMQRYRNTWSKYEGWDPSMYDRYAGDWQIQYRLLGS